MIDRDKILKGLECCASHNMNCSDCPYDYDLACSDRLENDTVELLKADQLELIRLRDRIESLERIVDHLEITIKEISNIQTANIVRRL